MLSKKLKTPIQLFKSPFKYNKRALETSAPVFVNKESNDKSYGQTKYDCVVVGLGAMGSSTLYHLAKSGQKVIGIEQFHISHNFGSSHGLSRIIRLSYFENPAYVAMLRRAFQLWDTLEKESHEKLFTRTGSLDVGPRDSTIYNGSKLTCKKEKLEHELLNLSQLKERFPGWQSVPNSADLQAVFQPNGGVLHPEKCVTSHVKCAEISGAVVRRNETVLDLIPYGKKELIVKTNKNEYLTKKVVLSSGPWLSGFIKQSKLLSSSKAMKLVSTLLRPQRNVVIWYKSSKPSMYQPSNFPVFCLDHENSFYYGFPIIDSGAHEFEKDGFKIGKYHHLREDLAYEMLGKNADWRTRFTGDDEQDMGQTVKTLFNDAYGPITNHAACIFTNTPDEHFIIDPLPDPEHPQLAVISACSGHGFKFSSVIGEIMATLLEPRNKELTGDEAYKHAKIDWLKLKRFS